MTQPVLIFLPSALTWNFELVLARAMDLNASLGDEVIVSYCTGSIKGCDANPYGFNALCSECVRVCTSALNELLPEVPRIPFEPTTLADNGDAQEHAYDGARSTILTFYRQDIRHLNYRARSAWLLPGINRRFVEYGLGTYRFARTLIRQTRPSRIEYCNGRLLPTMSLRQAAIDDGTNYCAIEVSGINRTLFLAQNASVHDLEFLKARLAAYELNDQRRALGVQFFQDRRAGLRTNDRSFTNEQIPDLRTVSDGHEIVSVFLSSMDEFLVFGDQWFTDSSRDPAGFLARLRDCLSPHYEIVVRMHPNQAGDRTGATDAMRKALSRIAGISVIKPRDKRSSYELLDQSRAVVTFGSTMGLEAAFWGRPSILVGRSVWEDAGVATTAEDAAQAARLIEAGPRACDPMKAVRVAAYLMDTIDRSQFLSYDQDSGKFLAGGRNYLSEKRRSFVYKLNRVIYKALLQP